jgi:hypothetical protein
LQHRTGYRLGDAHLELGSHNLASSECHRESRALVSQTRSCGKIQDLQLVSPCDSLISQIYMYPLMKPPSSIQSISHSWSSPSTRTVTVVVAITSHSRLRPIPRIFISYFPFYPDRRFSVVRYEGDQERYGVIYPRSRVLVRQSRPVR